MPYIVTLIANPHDPVLDGRLAGAAADAIGSKTVCWLADGIACDIVVAENADPESLDGEIRRAIGRHPVDVVIQDRRGRRRKALIADMDSTMIEQECIDELAAEAGIEAEISQITRRAMNGEIPFKPALKKRVALLKGLPVGIIDTVLKTRITLTPGARELVATMRANGAYTSLVSGGFSQFTRAVAELLGFDENHANELEQSNGKLTGLVKEPILGRKAKVTALFKIAAGQKISAADFIAVGDGANDLGMLEAAGAGVALHAKPSVAAAADIRIDHADLSALLYIQGYRKSEFVT